MTHRNITHRLVQQTNCQIRYALLTWIFIIKGIFVGGFDLGPLLALMCCIATPRKFSINTQDREQHLLSTPYCTDTSKC